MSPEKGSLPSDLLEEGTPVDWALKVKFKLKGYFKEALVSRGQSPCWLEHGGAAGEEAGAALGSHGRS